MLCLRFGIIAATSLWWIELVHAATQNSSVLSTLTIKQTVSQTVTQTVSKTLPASTTTITTTYTAPAATTVTVRQTVSLAAASTSTKVTVTQTSTITQTLPAQTSTITQTLPAQTSTTTQTLPAQTSTTTQTLPAQTSTTTQTLPAQTSTTTTTATSTVVSTTTIIQSASTSSAAASASVVAPYALIQYSDPSNVRGCGNDFLGSQIYPVDYKTIVMREYSADFLADRYQLDSNGVVRVAKFCPGPQNCTSRGYNDQGMAIYYNPAVPLGFDPFLGSASRLQMLADNDPLAAIYVKANCAIGPNSTFGCYWGNTGVLGDFWQCGTGTTGYYLTLTQSGFDMPHPTQPSDNDFWCGKFPAFTWRPFNESTAIYTLRNATVGCSP